MSICAVDFNFIYRDLFLTICCASCGSIQGLHDTVPPGSPVTPGQSGTSDVYVIDAVYCTYIHAGE